MRTSKKRRAASKPKKAKPNTFQLAEATEDEFESLKASIEAHGVLLPILQDSMGNVIDGKLKKKICEELGIKKFPTEILKVDVQTAEQIRLELNYCRRQVSLDDKRQRARLKLVTSPEQSDRQIARLTGLSHRTVAGIREGMVVRGQIVQVKVRRGKDGKTYKRFPKLRAKTKKEVEKAEALLAELGDDAPDREMELRSAKRRLREIRRARKPPQPPLKGDIKIEHSDFRKLELQPGSVDMIFCDPPYPKDFLSLYSDLSEVAARVLKPGGILMAYAGQIYLNEVFRRLDEHLNYLWMCVLINNTCSMPQFQRGFFAGHRPIPCYTNGPSKWYTEGRVKKHDAEYVRDVFDGRGKDKSLHPWQQSTDEAIYYISKLTKPGDLILDCCGGTFTTAEAVYRIGGGRRFIGCDIDEKCVAIGRERLAKLMNSNGFGKCSV
jgi:ParB-like chromosome segregation protein Spo0J